MRAVIGAVLLLAASASAQTTIYAKNSASLLRPRAAAWWGMTCAKMSSGPYDYEFLLLAPTAPSSATSDSFVPPNGTTEGCWFQRATNTYMAFVSPPLSAGVTISGNISGACSGVESAAQLNSGCTLELYKWDGRRGGFAGLIWTGSVAAEFGTSCALKAINAKAVTCSPSSACALVAGDRLVAIPRVYGITTSSPGGFSPNGTRTSGLCFNGAAGGANDINVAVGQTLAFAADSAGQKVEQVQ